MKLVPVDWKKLVALAEPTVTTPPASPLPQSTVDLPAVLEEQGFAYIEKEKEFDGEACKLFELEVCPFDPEHDNSAAYIIQWPNGGFSFGCFHNGCKELKDERNWRTLATKWELPIFPKDVSVEDITFAEAAEPVVVQQDVQPAVVQPDVQPAVVSVTPPIVVAAYRPFPVEVLPLPLQPFVADATQSMLCDPAYVSLPLLAGLFSVVGATRRLQVRTDWFEQAVMWEATIGESGTQKSGAQELPLRPLEAMQAARLDELPELLENYERDKLLFESDKKIWHSTGRKNDEEPPEKPQPPRVIQFIVGDSTIEALAELLADNPRGVLCSNDELNAWLGGMGRYKAGHGRGELGQWLSMHRAGRLLVNRKTGSRRVLRVRHAAVSIVGSITPEAFRKAMVDAGNLDSGLAARLIVAMPPRVPKRWGDGDGTALSMPAIQRLYQRLLALDFRYEDDSPFPQDILLDDKAAELARTFVDQHGQEQQAYEGHLASVYSKVEAMSFRFALLHCLVRWAAGDAPTTAQGQVTAEDLAAGIKLGQWCAAEWERVFSSFYEPAEARTNRELVEWIRDKGGETTARELTHGQHKYRGAGAAEAALQMLVEAGLGRWRTEQKERGRPKVIFQLL